MREVTRTMMFNHFLITAKYNSETPKGSEYIDAYIIHEAQVLAEFFWPNRLLWSHLPAPYSIPGYHASSD